MSRKAGEPVLPRIPLSEWRAANGYDAPAPDTAPCTHEPPHVMRDKRSGVDVVLVHPTRPVAPSRMLTYAMAEAERAARDAERAAEAA